MAVLASTTFSGGSAGAAVTAVSEPFFTSKTGTVTYAAIGDGRMGMRPNSADVGQMFRSSVNGRTKFGLQWKKKFESSTATSAYYFGLCLRNSTTVRSDVGLRNASGNRHAAFRNNFVYVGEATGNTMNAGEIWSFETVVDGTSQVVHVWEADVNFDLPTPTPTYTWSATLAVAPDNFFYGMDANSGVSVIIFDVRFTDGEPIVVQVAASGTLSLSGSASSSVSVARAADGALTLSGTASRAVTVARTASGTLTLTGTAERAVTVTRTATGTLGLTGTATTTGSTDRTADGLLTLTGTASVSVTISRTAEGTLALGGIGTVTFQIVRTAMGILNLTGVGTIPGRTIPDRLTLTEIAVSHTLTDITISHTLEDA